MTTSPRQISIFTEDESTSSLEGFRASLTQQQVSDLERKMTDTSGRKCLEQFERFSHVGSWAKMYAGLLIGMTGWYSTRCRLTWKLKGTKSSRFYFQLAVSTLPTEEIGSGLLQTPSTVEIADTPENMRARAKKNGYQNGTKYNSLKSQLMYDKNWNHLLPTPREAAARGNCSNNRNKGNLEDYIAKGFLPTPTADDNPAKNTGKRNQDGLQKRAFQATGKTSQLNPQFVMEMMGFPPDWSGLPFLSGETNPSKPEGTP